MPGESKDDEASASRLPTPRNQPKARRLQSGELFQGARDLIIVHEEEEYRLRITRLGKLILTK